MIIQINYDLKKPGQDYSELIEKIKSYGDWAHPCESSWLISTSQSAQSVFDGLKPYIDANDRVLVNQFDTSNYAGWMTEKIWSWIRSHSDSMYRYR